MSNDNQNNSPVTLQQMSQEDREKLLEEIKRAFTVVLDPETAAIYETITKVANDKEMMEELAQKIVKEHGEG